MAIWGNVVGVNDDSYTTCTVCETPKKNIEFNEQSKICSDCLGDMLEISSKWGCESCREVFTFDMPVLQPDKCKKCGESNFRRIYLA